MLDPVDPLRGLLSDVIDALAQSEQWTPDDMAYRPNGLSQPEQEPVGYGEEHMTPVQALEIIKLLSALESWSFSLRERLPDYQLEKIAPSIEVLEKEVLK